MSFDLNTLAAKDTTEFHLRHPVTDEFLYADAEKKLPVMAVLYGPSSKQYRNQITAMQNRSLKRGKKVVSAEVLRDEGIELLVACSERIDNLTFNGKPVNTDSAFRELYADAAYDWLKSQIDAALGDAASFLAQ